MATRTRPRESWKNRYESKLQAYHDEELAELVDRLHDLETEHKTVYSLF